MKKEIFKVELDGKIIFSKPLLPQDPLNSIREFIKPKIDFPFIFLDQEDNAIDQEDEKDYKLEDVHKGKIIKVKREGSGSVNNQNNSIKIFLNDKNICSIDCSQTQNLIIAREKIKEKFRDDFTFLDSDKNDVDQNDEGYYQIENILNSGVILIKAKISKTKDSAPATPINKEDLGNNKPKNPKKKTKIKISDFSKYQILNKRSDLITYKYSNLERTSNHKLVYQYFYDRFDVNDYSNAYVVLFCGKTGDGKSTAINAFFNIIKGVELRDDYRFILITEPQKKKGQAESQTDGVHLYYLKDYINKPVIIIDSQGYGDTRGQKYDEMVNDAFRFVFSNVIDHINAVCFISKSNTNRLDILTRYIFNSVTCLFSEDISENFIVTATFASKNTKEEGPAFVESIQTDAEFLNIKDRIEQKWWYAFDSKSILDNDEDKLTKYSFEQLNELYEEKVKKLRPKSVKKSAEVLETRNELKVQVNLLSDTFENLLVDQANLQEKEKVINEISGKITDMETRINNFMKDAQTLNPHQLEERMRELNLELSDKLNNLSNETVTEYITSCERNDNYTYTHCDTCERNCHNECDCNFQLFGRCKVFSWGIIGDKICEECRCPKDSHKNDHYHWIKKSINKIKDNADKIREEKDRNERERSRYLEEINQKKKSKSELDKQINELNFNKKKLTEEKTKNLKDKSDIEKKIINTSNQITYIIIKLKNISDKINSIAMNNNNLKTEDEYIDFLKDKMEEIGMQDEDQKKALKKMKENNRIFREVNQLDEKDIMSLNDSQLAEKLGVIIPKSKKEMVK